MKYERERLLEVSLASSHFLTNSIALSDIFVHLLRFVRDDSCSFEPAKSSNAFLFSVVGAYADLVTTAYAVPGSPTRTLGWIFFSVSTLSAFCSVWCYIWGSRSNAVCPPREVGKLRLDIKDSF